MEISRRRWAMLFVCLLCLSCGKAFLDTRPTDQLDWRTALSSEENIYAALNGIHRSMVAQYLSHQACGGEASMCIIRDALGEDLVHPNTSNSFYLNVLRWVDHRNETSVLNQYPFVFYYYLILQANLILEALEPVATGDTLIRPKGIKGEALCFRAWAHFQLVQLYGGRYVAGVRNDQKGVPYRLSSSSQPLARNTVEECYHYILEDLDQAFGYLKDYTPENVTHFSLKVAYGLKARVLLTQQDYTGAARYAEQAIRIAEKEGFRLMNRQECLTGFSCILSQAKEALWASHTLEDQSIAFFSFYAYLSWNFNSTAIRLTPRCINSRLYNRIAVTDVRAAWWDASGQENGPTGAYQRFAYQNRKFKAVSSTLSAGDFAYMRLAELYLIQAEALARSGLTQAAQQILYELVSTRDTAYEISRHTGEALIEEIMLHRRIELWGEGFRFTDLKRLNLPLDRRESNHLTSVCGVMEVPAGDVRWQWLIPADEIQVALGKVEQNE